MEGLAPRGATCLDTFDFLYDSRATSGLQLDGRSQACPS